MKLFHKKSFIIFLILVGAVIIGSFIYGQFFRNLPEFALTSLNTLPRPVAQDRILLISPHCDDETLSSGGYIYEAEKAGAQVEVVLVTNGDGERFSTTEESKKIMPRPEDYVATGYLRQKESLAGLKILGVPENQVIFLGYPDGGIKALTTSNWQIPYDSLRTKTNFSPYANSYQNNVSYTGENLKNNLNTIVTNFAPTIILTSDPLDLHADHAAIGKLTQDVLQSHQNYQLYYYLIHFRRFPYPKNLNPTRYITPPLKLLANRSWQNLDLTPEAEQAKQQAVLSYTSQLKEPFLKSLMLGFVKQNEIFSKF